MPLQGFTLTSPDFVPDGVIPTVATCDGKNTSPELKWLHAPEGTRSYVLIVDDPDAPSGTFTHWVLFDIPSDVQSLGAGEKNVGIQGRNDFEHEGYGGPCPPPNHGQHRYFFKLHALDIASLGLQPAVDRKSVEQAMEGHVLTETMLMGRYSRTTG